ncbi:nuclear receptor subfamily 2 group E member 1-like isoform X1 [Amphibalanus amphitrite]|uniref:nuclear receptor subfamily 2 group E member 1-like isoform X1 n=1 Tax=Amphibalanus amphitrite TaxID=1232801 RepID=UPI001C8FD27E|nr:nuclear receptor subfamily 2 group E member 1-like isoform X1 [Amphibalanus amphitrite]
MDLSVAGKMTTSPSSRILYDIPCKVCQDHSSGKHYGIFACDGCAGFFKRSIRRNRQYVCKAKEAGGCLVDKTHRNQCRACRLSRCIQAGMNRDAVQHERGPRNSTLRRQMSLLYGDGGHSPGCSPPPPPPSSAAAELSRPAAERAGEPAGRANSSSPQPAGEPPLPLPAPPTSAALPYLPIPKYGRGEFLLPLVSSPETLCESAARILFGNVDWSKHLPAFTALPYRDQVVLLQESWRELFVLSLAQTVLPVEVEPLLALAGAAVHQSAEHVLPLLKEVGQLREVVARLRALRVDPTEYMCLKWIVLFKTEFPRGGSPLRELQQAAAVSVLQDQAQLTLTRYSAAAYPTQPTRLAKLLLVTATLRDVPAALIEQLFFKKTIRDIPIERLITDMFKKNEL